MSQLSLLCLAFLSANPTEAPPENISSLLKQRLQHQWSQHRPEIALEFTQDSCSHTGQITYHENYMELTADHSAWRGTLPISYQDLLDGKALQFSTVSPLSKNIKVPSYQKNHEPRSNRKWLPWVLATVGVGVTATLIHQRNEQIKRINAFNLKF